MRVLLLAASLIAVRALPPRLHTRANAAETALADTKVDGDRSLLQKVLRRLDADLEKAEVEAAVVKPAVNTVATKVTNRYVVITMGPTGAGKSKLPEAVAQQLDLRKGTLPHPLLVDDFVEGHPDYKRTVLNILMGMWEGKTEAQVEQLFNNPSARLLKEFGKAYYGVRTETEGCDPLLAVGNCDDANDTKLRLLLAQGKDVVVESTGEYVPDWVAEFVAKHKRADYQYQIVYAFTLVNFEELIKRNQQRAFKAAKEFLEDQTKPAPRFPDVGSGENGKFYGAVTKIRETIKTLITHPSAHSQSYSKLLLFDNNGKGMKLVGEPLVPANEELDDEAKNKANDLYCSVVRDHMSDPYGGAEKACGESSVDLT